MQLELLQHVDPLRLAKQNSSMEGQISLADMPRVVEHHDVSANQGEAVLVFELRFWLDNKHYPHVWGHFFGDITLACQRCLKEMVVHVDIEAEVIPVLSEEKLEKLSDPAQGWLMDASKRMSIQQWVEDEILLWMPLVVRHSEPECFVDSEN